MFRLMSHNEKSWQVKNMNSRKAKFSSDNLSAHYGTDFCGASLEHIKLTRENVAQQMAIHR